MGTSFVSAEVRATSLSGDIDALLRRPEPTRRPAGWVALTLALRAAAVFCATTGVMLALWTVGPAILLRWSAAAIESGSMGPAVERGDVVLLRPLAEPEHPVEVGSVVRFRLVDGSTVVHRVEAVEPERRSYRTRGDANTARDGAAVPYDRVDGVGQMLVPLMGFPLLWVRQPAWAPLLVCLLGVVAIAWPLVVDGLRDPHTTPGRDRSIPLSAFTAVVAEGLGSGGGQRNDRAST